MGKTKATNFLRLIAFGVPIMQLSNYLVKYSENESATFFTFELEAVISLLFLILHPKTHPTL